MSIVNPWMPKSDKLLISSFNISPESSIEVWFKKKNILVSTLGNVRLLYGEHAYNGYHFNNDIQLYKKKKNNKKLCSLNAHFYWLPGKKIIIQVIISNHIHPINGKKTNQK